MSARDENAGSWPTAETPAAALTQEARLFLDDRELLELAQEAGRVGTFEWDITSDRVRLSPNFLGLYGLENFDGQYASWLACIFREDVPRFTDVLERAFAAEEREIQAEFRIIRGNDRVLRWIEARKIVFYEKGAPKRVVGVNVDITERKRSFGQLRSFTEALEERVRERTRELEVEYEARRKAEEMLRQKQKMEAIGQLTGGIAHDFNNLLTIVVGNVEMLLRNLPPDAARMRRAADHALQGAHRAAALTQRLLAFARLQPLDPKAVDSNKLVYGMSELLRRTLGETISLEAVLGGGLWRTQADPNQLENSIINLAVNARDAMPDGGRLTIETANTHIDKAYVADIAEPVPPGQYVQISVTDTGSGMDQATISRVFEPFFTTKDVGKGTGLGLSQVYGFVRQSGGHVRIYSELGEGTTVKIYLPRHLSSEDDVAITEEICAAVERGEGETILVVEDEEKLRAYAADALGELGYRVITAADGPTAIALLAQEKTINLLFTDIVLPGGMNGRQLADEALKQRPHLKVLFTTGYTRNAVVRNGQLDPGVDLIGKPFTFEDLASSVRRLLDSE